jgi:1,2-diacylglycerol 3-alpha-glucosyltransferase
LEAYHFYRQTSDTNWALVICGGGLLEAELRYQVAVQQIPDVFFPGFHKGNELAVYYGLASCFIHPSIQEQWGLVVNEAMASGLPVLVSRFCGCVPNLVREGINGFTFDPTNPLELAKLMDSITRNPAQLECMSTAAQHTIAEYSPDKFAANLVLAMNANR